jgi:S1-C subfamily serine protease
MMRLTVMAGLAVSLSAMNYLGDAQAEMGGTAEVWHGQAGLLQLVQSQSQESPADIYRNNIHGVFTIIAGDGYGSGFTFSSGLIATNAHVVGDASMVEVVEQGGDRFRAKVIKKNVDQDFAILEPEGIRPFTTLLPLRTTGSTPAIGESIVVIGSPGGLKGTVTAGIVSQMLPGGIVQLNVAINPGNSGGPVFDRQGQVFGIATMKYSGGDGIGLAIPLQWLLVAMNDPHQK